MIQNVILETSGEFRGFTAVDGLNLRVRRGTIRFNGQDITHEKPAQIARRGVVRSFQISAVFPHLTVLKNVRVALQRRLGTSFHFWRSQRSLDVLNERARGLLGYVGLAELVGLLVVEMPYGRKRALEIATTLALKPELILLDEPTQGMGSEDVDRVMNLIKKVSANRTILMVENNMGTAVGPVIGAATIVTLQNTLANKVGPLLTVIMGVIFVVCVLLFRRGVAGECTRLYCTIVGNRSRGSGLTGRRSQAQST